MFRPVFHTDDNSPPPSPLPTQPHRLPPRFSEGQKRTANALYIILIILAHITIGVTTIFVALATAYFIIHGLSRGDESLGKLEADCFFSDVDDKVSSDSSYCRSLYFRPWSGRPGGAVGALVSKAKH